MKRLSVVLFILLVIQVLFLAPAGKINNDYKEVYHHGKANRKPYAENSDVCGQDSHTLTVSLQCPWMERKSMEQYALPM